MHVAYLVNQYPKISHTFIRREINALEELGIRVSRFALRTDGTEQIDPLDAAEHGKTRYVLKEGVVGIGLACLAALVAHPAAFFKAIRAALRLGRLSASGVVRHLIYFAEACVLRRWLRDTGATHLHSHFGTNASTVALLCWYLDRVPFSFTIHGPEEFDMPAALGLPEKIREAAFVAAISSFCRSQIYRWTAEGDWPKIHIVRCALDFTEFPAPVWTARLGRLVCVGRLSPDKGQLLLVRALSLLARRGLNPELVLAGDGPIREEIEQLAAGLGVAGQVRITGWVSGERIRQELREAQALVLPSFAEGLPVAIMEAMAVGRPVVSTYIAGIPELVVDRETGWLVPAGDIDQLARVLEEVLAAGEVRLSEMGQRGRVRVEAMHDIRREAQVLAARFK